LQSVFEGLKQEWKGFAEAKPGERFRAHQATLAQKSRVALIGRAAFGVLLFAAGVVMLFAPGPGLLVMVFGFALAAGQSHWVAARLDRGEVAGRAAWGKLKRRWLAATTGVKVLIVALAVVLAASAALVMVRLVLA